MVGGQGSVRSSGSVLSSAARGTLLVIYTEHIEACSDFYAGIGLDLVQEQQGAGPVHYAAELAGGLVLELYPGRPERTTGRLRLGFTVPVSDDLPAGEHRLTDLDGRVIVVETVAESEQHDTG